MNLLKSLMPPSSKTPDPSPNRLGTTMRIEISPEVLHEAKRGKGRPIAGVPIQPIIKDSRPSVTATPLGGLHFQQLLQNVYDAVLIIERSGQVLAANIRANQFFLAEPDQLRQHSVLTLICGADESLLPTILETLEGNRFVLMQAYCRRMDETRFPTEISVNQLVLEGQDYLSFFIRDVTLRKQQEERLHTGNTAIQNASSGIAIATLDAVIEYCNPAFRSYFGLTEEQVQEEHSLREFLCQPELADEVLSAIWSGETWAGELELKGANGEVFFGHTSVTPNLNADSELVGMVLSVLDITPQKRAQQQLQSYAAELGRKNAQMQADLNMASELHEAFLPSGFDSFPRGAIGGERLLDFRYLYHPSGTIGGDFFDIYELSDHEVAVFISDVMGHGIRSALVVATIRGLIEQLRPIAGDPGALMTQLNAAYVAIFAHMGSDLTFATALYAVFDTRTGALRYANASHPRPYVLRSDRGEVNRLNARVQEPATALGLFATAKYQTLNAQLGPKDMVLFYTDGLSEVENPNGEFYETLHFEEALRANLDSSPKLLVERLFEDARGFSTAPAFEDDICMLAMQVLRINP